MSSNWNRLRDRLKNRDGQSIILVGIMVLSFLMFFTFTVNTGLLIHAKISVQAAADAAAYAGAATQARQLNSISFLNYDMRQQYKKFLFRYVFVGSIGNPHHPLNSDQNPGDAVSSGQYDFPKFDFRDTSYTSTHNPIKLALKVPVICIPIVGGKTPDDSCLKINIRNSAHDLTTTLGLGSGSGSAIIQTYLAGVEAMNSQLENTCTGLGAINKLVMNLWLFRGNTSDQPIDDMFTQLSANQVFSGTNSSDATKVKNEVKGLVGGLGLFPRNLLDYLRIRTLEKHLNEKATTITQEDASSMERSTRAEFHERTLLAFKSALSNLNASLFDPDKVVMEELQPSTLIKLSLVKTPSFKIFIQDAKPGTASTDKTFCNARITPTEVNGVPIGVQLDPGHTVMYAVRLKTFVRARGLMFSPWSGELELDAVAGAKPFGSRIGPRNLNPKDYVKSIPNLPIVNEEPLCAELNNECTIPNIELNSGKDILRATYIEALLNLAKNSNGEVDMPSILQAQFAATAPNPIEVGNFNILPPVKTSQDEKKMEFIAYDDGQFDKNTPPAYRFYAPLFPAGTANSTTELQSILQQAFPDSSMAPMLTLLNSSLNAYISGTLEPAKNEAELQESKTFAAVALPIHPNLQPPKGAEAGNWLTKEAEVISSWGPSYARLSNGSYGFKPRFGYSVKHVAVRDLVRQGVVDTEGDLEAVGH